MSTAVVAVYAQSIAAPTDHFDQSDHEHDDIDSQGQEETNDRPDSSYMIQWMLLFVLGLINNLPGVVVISASKSLSEEFNQNNLMGLLNWANIGLGLLAKISTTTCLLHTPSTTKMLLTFIFFLCGLLLLAAASKISFDLAIVAILLVGAASSIGESTLLGYFKHFHPKLVGAWSSGTGMAGIAGTFLYLMLFSWLKLSNFIVFCTLCPLAIVYYATFLFLSFAYGPEGQTAKVRRHRRRQLGRRNSAAIGEIRHDQLQSNQQTLVFNQDTAETPLLLRTSPLSHNVGDSSLLLSPSRLSRRGMDKQSNLYDIQDNDETRFLAMDAGFSHADTAARSQALDIQPPTLQESQSELSQYVATPSSHFLTSNAAYMQDSSASGIAGGVTGNSFKTNTGSFTTHTGGGGGVTTTYGEDDMALLPYAGSSPSQQSKTIPRYSGHSSGDTGSDHSKNLSNTNIDTKHMLPTTMMSLNSTNRRSSLHSSSPLEDGDDTDGEETILQLEYLQSSNAIDSISLLEQPVSAAAEQTVWQQLKRVWPMVGPMATMLASIYFFEYCIITILASHANPNASPEDPWARRNAYEVLQCLYQIGVFLSRSSIDFIQIRRTWILTLFQVINFIIWTLHDQFFFLKPLIVQFVLMIWVGAMAGLCYVGTFYSLQNNQHLGKDKEFAINLSSIGVNLGITLSALYSLLADNTWMRNAPK